eukprot:XP_001611256.1 membrane protein [Babesia bovis T2Bo]
MTWYHWVLLVLLLLLQVVAVVLEQNGWGLFANLSITSTYPIYGVAVVLLGILAGTLYCGWKCNLFCRPCCKSQYVCYGSAIVVVLAVLVVLAVTASLPKIPGSDDDEGEQIDQSEGETKMHTIGCLGKVILPITQCYTMAVLWITILRLPYTLPQLVTILASALALTSILPLIVMCSIERFDSATAYPLLAVHLLSLGITWYCVEYKKVFHWSKDYMCFGVLGITVILLALVDIVIVIYIANYPQFISEIKGMEFTLLGYSFLLMVPTFWYAYRCGLLTWRWNSCLPKKKDFKAPDTADNTTTDSGIAKE